jgi:RNA polymerase sigma-70 factor (ECF subfamily)
LRIVRGGEEGRDPASHASDPSDAAAADGRASSAAGWGEGHAPTDEALFERYAPYVARIGLRLLGREADVDDLIQEVFLAAFKQKHQLRDGAAFKSWLATVAVRTARRQLRRRKLRSFVGLDTLAPSLELRDPAISPERRALLTRVYKELDELPVDQRLAWTLRYVQGEKLERVAERCGCSLATAKRRIAAAHARIQAELNDG